MGAVIQHGTLEEFARSRSEAPGPPTERERLSAGPYQSRMDFKITNHPRGLVLKSIVLEQGFEGFLGNLFSPRHEVYFISWAWDLSGAQPFLHPEGGARPESVIIPMRVGHVREFIGDGVLLFPRRSIMGGIAVRIMLWESDADLRAVGRTIDTVASKLRQSEFTSRLVALAGLATVPTAAVYGIATGALELASTISAVLKENGDDYVDFYEGYFAADQAWKRDEQTYRGDASRIVVGRL